MDQVPLRKRQIIATEGILMRVCTHLRLAIRSLCSYVTCWAHYEYCGAPHPRTRADRNKPNFRPPTVDGVIVIAQMSALLRLCRVSYLYNLFESVMVATTG